MSARSRSSPCSTPTASTLIRSSGAAVTVALATQNCSGPTPAVLPRRLRHPGLFVLKSGGMRPSPGCSPRPRCRWDGARTGPARKPRDDLHPWVMFGIVPVVRLRQRRRGIDRRTRRAAVRLPLAIALGLFLGKQIGVFGAIRLACASGLCASPRAPAGRKSPARAPHRNRLHHEPVHRRLAFPGRPEWFEAAKIGILVASLLSAVVGWAVLRIARTPAIEDPDEVDDVDEAERIFSQKRGEPQGS